MKRIIFSVLIGVALLVPTTGKAQILEGLKLGASGELHYNDIVSNESGVNEKGEFDFHKLVFQATYNVSKKFYVKSKLKVEHAFDSHYNGGDVYLDQMYLMYKLKPALHIKAGLISVPLMSSRSKLDGSVETSHVDKYMTYSWRELGVGFEGYFSDRISYKATISTGLEGAEIQNKSGIYSARNSDFFSSVNNLAAALQLKLKLTPALTFGNTVLYSGLQSKSEFDEQLEGAGYATNESFIQFHHGNISARAVGVYSSIRSVEKLNQVYGNGIGSSQYGGLVELGYDFTDLIKITENDKHLIALIRAEKFDTQYRTTDAKDKSKYERHDYTFAVLYQPLNFLEFKADFQILGAGGLGNSQQFDFGVSFHF